MRDSKLPKWQYPDEFKVDSTRLAESAGGHEAARRWGVPVVTLGNWKQRTGAPEAVLNAGAVPTRRPMSQLEAENSRLRRELPVVGSQ